MSKTENPLRSEVGSISRLSILSENNKPRELTRCQTYCLLWGHENTGVTVLLIGMSAAAFFIFSAYRSGFSRDGIWIFFALGIVPCLLIVSFVVRVCIAIRRVKSKGENKARDENRTAETTLSNSAVMFRSVTKMYNDIADVNGKFYLAKMYASEAFEHIQQIYSMTTMYVCSMPVGVSCIVSSVLTIELLTNLWVTFHFESQESRDRLILLDVFKYRVFRE